MEANQHALADTRLYEASMNGDVDTLNHLIQEDPLVLTRMTPTFFHENPLHIAAMHGHFSYVEELIRHCPALAEEVDAWGHTALHLASAKGFVATVKVLVQGDCRTCLRRNNEGRLPLHLAIMKRHDMVVRELVRAHPEAVGEAMDQGHNAAHLCVRTNYLEGLRGIVEELDHHGKFLASVDGDGNTILHLAAAFKHLKMVEYIIKIMHEEDGEMRTAKNKKGQTALDMAENSMPRDLEGLEIANLLITVGIPRGMPAILIDTCTTTVHPKPPRRSKTFREMIHYGLKKFVAWTLYYDNKWVETMSGWLIIVAILVATVAFQAGVQPPGGVWPQDHLLSHSAKTNTTVYKPAGSAVAASNGNFFFYNMCAFLSSLSVILLLVSGAPLHHRCCTWVLIFLIWTTLSFMTLTYSETMYVVNPPRKFKVKHGSFSYVFNGQPDSGPTITIWFVVLGGVLTYQLLVVVVWLANLLYRFVHYLRRPSA